MLKIKGNKLSAEGFRFELPEGCYIDIDGMEGTSPNSIRFLTAERDMSINIRTESADYASSMDALKDSFTDFVFESGSAMELFEDKSNTEYRWIEEPMTFQKNGMRGSRTIYFTRNKECCRIYYDKIQGYKEFLDIYMETYGEDVHIINVFNRHEIRKFLDSICLEDKNE